MSLSAVKFQMAWLRKLERTFMRVCFLLSINSLWAIPHLSSTYVFASESQNSVKPEKSQDKGAFALDKAVVTNSSYAPLDNSPWTGKSAWHRPKENLFAAISPEPLPEQKVLAKFSLQSSQLQIVSLPETAVVGESVGVVVNLSQVCGSSQTAPLAGRTILFFTNLGDCGVDVGQQPAFTALTDVSGNASVRLAFSETGTFGVRVKFQGDDKPDPCPSVGNSACTPTDPDPNQRCVNIGSSNDCQTIVVTEYSIPIIFDAAGAVNLVVTDPSGDSIGVSFNTISGSSYSYSDDSIFIFEALYGNYSIKVVRDLLDESEDSSYAIESRIDGTADNALTSAAPVPQEGETHNYVITSQPDLPACLSKPGDADGDGLVNLADIVSTVNYLYNYPGCQPSPDCWLWGLNCRGDWNGNGSITLSDVIHGANYLFGEPGRPWNPVSSQACCLPNF